MRAMSRYPCLCLCFGLVQMTRTTPRRRTILHLLHIRLTDVRTFHAVLSPWIDAARRFHSGAVAERPRHHGAVTGSSRILQRATQHERSHPR